MTMEYLVHHSPFDPDELTVLIEHRGMGTAVDHDDGMQLSPEAAFLLERAAMYQRWLTADTITSEPEPAERTARVSAVLGWLLTEMLSECSP